MSANAWAIEAVGTRSAVHAHVTTVELPALPAPSTEAQIAFTAAKALLLALLAGSTSPGVRVTARGFGCAMTTIRVEPATIVGAP